MQCIGLVVVTVGISLRFTLPFLPCSSCLRSWLENDTSCPTCRQSLASDLQPEQEEQRQPRGMAAFMMGRGLRRNHFFHFDGTNLDHIYS